jgi:hypothetical protein
VRVLNPDWRGGREGPESWLEGRLAQIGVSGVERGGI